MEEVRNRLGEIDGRDVIFCANHEDPACGNGDDRYGWAPTDMITSVGWLKVGDSLACTHYCAAKVAGLGEEEALSAKSAAFYNDPITEEQVANMPGGVSAQDLDLSALSEFDASAGGES